MRYTQFFTATILNWQHLIKRDDFKDIIVSALQHRVQLKQVRVYGFVLMPNHIHILWLINHDIAREDFQRDFLKYIAKQFIAVLRKENRSDTLHYHTVNARDRTLQIWERNALSIDIYSLEVFNQKLKYIHNNPIQEKWKLVEDPIEYKYSSCKFYETGIDDFDMLTNYAGEY